MLNYVALCIDENMTGANGELSRGDCVCEAAHQLVDYVHEALWDYGIGSGPEFRVHLDLEVYRAIERIVGAAMIAQYEYDQKQLAVLYKSITRAETLLPEIKPD
jgi:hypothetical protein